MLVFCVPLIVAAAAWALLVVRVPDLAAPERALAAATTTVVLCGVGGAAWVALAPDDPTGCIDGPCGSNPHDWAFFGTGYMVAESLVLLAVAALWLAGASAARALRRRATS